MLAFCCLVAAIRDPVSRSEPHMHKPGLIHPTYFLVFNTSNSVSCRKLAELRGWAESPLEMLLIFCGEPKMTMLLARGPNNCLPLVGASASQDVVSTHHCETMHGPSKLKRRISGSHETVCREEALQSASC